MPPTLPFILILCTGNICRSPMAEAAFAQRAASRGIAVHVESRGLAAPLGRSPDRHALEVAEKAGVTISPDKRSAAVSSAELSMASVVFVMEHAHRHDILRRFPAASGKTFLLGHWQNKEIIDPINQPVELFEQAWADIDLGVDTWIDHLLAAGLIKGPGQ